MVKPWVLSRPIAPHKVKPWPLTGPTALHKAKPWLKVVVTV
jgi:hypothetical protein